MLPSMLCVLLSIMVIINQTFDVQEDSIRGTGRGIFKIMHFKIRAWFCNNSDFYKIRLYLNFYWALEKKVGVCLSSRCSHQLEMKPAELQCFSLNQLLCSHGSNRHWLRIFHERSWDWIWTRDVIWCEWLVELVWNEVSGKWNRREFNLFRPKLFSPNCHHPEPFGFTWTPTDKT